MKSSMDNLSMTKLVCLILLLAISDCEMIGTNVTEQETIKKRNNALSLSAANVQYTNIAHLGTAEQISTHNWGDAYRCIDGKADGAWKNDDTNSICHTISGGLNWWRLTFLQSYYIHKVVIYPRSSLSLSGYTLKVIGYETNLDPTEIFSTYAEFNNVDRTGKALELQFTGYIQLSEVEVYGAALQTGVTKVDYYFQIPNNSLLIPSQINVHTSFTASAY
ncbi:hypothetical protein ACHWQZ_G015317 [Mnemiopsis leidyi]